jgi:hypothetical protein
MKRPTVMSLRALAKPTVVAVASALASVVVACKPQATDAGSQVQSLDNFAREDGAALSPNRCGPELSAATYASLNQATQRKLKRIEAPTAELERAAASALAAVPPSLQTMFYASEDNRILVTAESQSLCADAALTEAERHFAAESRPGGAVAQPTSCWRLAGGRLEVIVPADEAKVRHELVQIFAYVYTQLVVDRFGADVVDPEARSQLIAVRARFHAQADLLAQAFLDDVRATKAGPSLARFAESAPRDFKNFVVAALIDSDFCGSKPRAKAAAQFPQTWTAYTVGPAAMKKDLGAAWDER